MEVKKAPQADLEKRRSLFLQIGFVLVLASVLLAFEWSSYDVNVPDEIEVYGDDLVDVIIPITMPKDVTPPPPPPKTIIDLIKIVDDDTEIEDDNLNFSTEADEDESIFFEIPEVEEERDDVVFVAVEEMPEFPGGKSALMQFIANSVKYPEIALQSNIQGRVYVKFVVSKTGEVEDVVLLRGIHSALDNEAIRVVKSMPTWKPGRQLDKAVNVSYTVPINFSLR